MKLRMGEIDNQELIGVSLAEWEPLLTKMRTDWYDDADLDDWEWK
jgi:hypothetical protein